MWFGKNFLRGEKFMRTLFFLIGCLAIPVSFSCERNFNQLDDNDCGISYTGDWQAVKGGYHIALSMDLPTMEGYLHPSEDGIYDLYEDHLSLPNRTKVLYTLGDQYLSEVDQSVPSKEPIFKSVKLKKGEAVKVKLELLPPNIEEGRIVVFDKLRLVKVK